MDSLGTIDRSEPVTSWGGLPEVTIGIQVDSLRVVNEQVTRAIAFKVTVGLDDIGSGEGDAIGQRTVGRSADQRRQYRLF